MMQSIHKPSAVCPHRLQRPHSTGQLDKPFVRVQHSKARATVIRGVRPYLRTSCSAQTTEIILKGDDVWSAYLMQYCVLLHCQKNEGRAWDSLALKLKVSFAGRSTFGGDMGNSRGD